MGRVDPASVRPRVRRMAGRMKGSLRRWKKSAFLWHFMVPSLRGATARSWLLIPGNAEPQLGKGRGGNRGWRVTRQAGAWRSREPQPLTRPSLRGATARSRLLTPGNAEPQLGKGRESRMKSHSPSWGLAFPGTSSAHSPLASRRDNKVVAPYPGERRAPARQGEGIADEKPLAKLGLGVPGNLSRSLTPRFAARQQGRDSSPPGTPSPSSARGGNRG